MALGSWGFLDGFTAVGGFGFKVWGLEVALKESTRVWGSGGFGFWGLGFRVWVLGFRTLQGRLQVRIQPVSMEEDIECMDLNSQAMA